MVHKTWSEDEIAAYTTHLSEPARAYSSVLLYRTFLLREFVSVIRGRYLSMHLSVPTLILFGVRDFAISTRLLHGYAPYADDLKVEFVPNCGHFIAEERPRLVTRRILQLFGKDV